MTKSASFDQGMEQERGFDLLQVKWIRAVMISPLFPYVLQAVLLVFFIWLAVFGWKLFAPEGVPSKQYAKTNVVNLLIWALWWPAMIWTAVLFGRLWCAVCPLELVANITERVGRWLGVRQLVLKRWLQSGVLILVFYATIQMLVAGIQLHRVPAYTSIFLWSLIGVAAIVGFLFKDRAFCRAFCPVGLLLSVYGRGSMLAVRSKSDDTCASCPGKDCVQSSDRTHLDKRSCPSLLNPAKLNDNADCLVCGQCMKICPPSNMGLYLRRPFHGADLRTPLASWPITLFVMLVSGFITYELCSEWKAVQHAYLLVPHAISESGWVKGIWMLFVVPLLIWSVLGSLVLLGRGAKSMGEAWQRLALPMAVIISAAHMAKGLAKFSSWGGYFPGVLREPKGIETALAITSGAASKPAALLPITLVSIVGMILLVIMGYFAMRESHLADPESHRSRIAPLLLIWLAAMTLIYGWGFVG